LTVPSPPPADTTDLTADRTKVLAVDGNSLGHRGFHSARDDDDPAAPIPFVTGAVVSMLASAWVHGPYDAVVVGFDHEVNRRKLDHPEYKAQRPPSHPDLDGHLATLRTHLAACGFAVLEEEGAEADDLLAATVDACVARGWDCDLLSSDRDLTALVGPGTRLLRPRARFSDLEVEDEAAVRKRYGVEPHQYVDLAALRGDPSDGLTGAVGIGPKTAARLLRDHGSVAGIYDVLIDLHPKVEAALREGRERVERNLVLMAPIPHLEVDMDAALASGVDHERVVAVLEPLGLGGAGRRFAWACTAPPPPPVAPPPDHEPDEVDGVVAGQHARSARRELAPAPTDGEQVALF
jgi:5'-3' exonuclease